MSSRRTVGDQAADSHSLRRSFPGCPEIVGALNLGTQTSSFPPAPCRFIEPANQFLASLDQQLLFLFQMCGFQLFISLCNQSFDGDDSGTDVPRLPAHVNQVPVIATVLETSPVAVIAISSGGL